jgi:hypothetical protein
MDFMKNGEILLSLGFIEGGVLHKVGTPAIIHADGTCEWWVNGRRLQN